ncbi:MAG: hypothetical protein QM730_25530 [Anaerolineales bacterium]
MRKITSLFFLIIFSLGTFSGFLLTVMATWADMEAASYGLPRTGGERLTTLYCPILMTKSEIGTFSVKVVNTTDKKIASSIRTDIATQFDPVSSIVPVQLAPGETKRIEEKIGPENLILGQFIFARASVNAYPLPERENSCGVFVVDLPTNGSMITWTMVGLSLLGMSVGLYGMTRSKTFMNSQRMDIRLLILVASLVIVGILSSFLGWWMLGLLATIVFVLTLLMSFYTARK